MEWLSHSRVWEHGGVARNGQPQPRAVGATAIVCRALALTICILIFAVPSRAKVKTVLYTELILLSLYP